MDDEIMLDEVDRRILDIIQSDFPLVSRPYAVIGERLGISEDDAFRRVGRMRAARIIRRLGANFQSAGLGFVSTLCAASVPADRLEEFVEKVNALPGVTHNYLRDHACNIWFTLISPSCEEQLRTLEALERETGIVIMNLPASRLYKIKVDFPMAEGILK